MTPEEWTAEKAQTKEKDTADLFALRMKAKAARLRADVARDLLDEALLDVYAATKAFEQRWNNTLK